MSAKINFVVIGLILGIIIIYLIYGNPLASDGEMQAKFIMSGNFLGLLLYWLIPLLFAIIGYFIGNYLDNKINT